MRKALVLGLSAIVFAGGVAPSEARFRFRGGGHSTPVRAPVAAPSLAVVPGFTLRGEPFRATSPVRAASAVMTAEALTHGVESTVPIAAPIAAVPPAPVAKPDPGPWCASGRLAGSGSGFCLIN